MNIFEQASRMKLRFVNRGSVSTEQLWELHVQTLDEMYRAIQASNKDVPSLLGSSGLSECDELRCAIIKHVVGVKLALEDEQKQAVVRRQKRDKILALMEQKQDEALSQRSLEELEGMLNEL